MPRPIGNVRIAAILSIALAEPTALAKEDAEIWRGYLIDKKCASTAQQDQNLLDNVQHHTTECSLQKDSVAAGFCIFSNDQWMTLDKVGNRLALKLLKQSKRKTGCFVQVTGTVDVQTLHDIEVDKTGKVEVTGARELRLLKTKQINETTDPRNKWSI